MDLQGNQNAPPPLELGGFADWLVEQGLLGLPLEEQFSGFCDRLHAAGFDMARASMGMGTLHPRYGAQTYVWRVGGGPARPPGKAAVEIVMRDRISWQNEDFQASPIHHMRTTGTATLRRRLDRNAPLDFPILEDLRQQGMSDYAAHLVLFGKIKESDEARSGVFFSCATARPGGFDDAQLTQVAALLPIFGLAVKSRTTYDIGRTVVETYLGRDAGDRVLTGAIDRGSVETISAVLWFCDLRGFTRVSDRLPGDELVETLDDYLELMAGPVHANHGQILKFLGDGFLATFDLTALDGEAVCRNALKAAAELRAAFPPFNEARQEAGKAVMDFGLALHLGDVLYGNIGASDRLDFTVIGPAVNEASRIQSLCRPMERNTLISAAFHEVACGCHGELESLGFHALRGVREPQELFTLKG
ncbi:MAG TPA: adenylate/guanylate cyclase domain-containing protein [Alphaproteobacteria bacterium]|nr:adenylate/guanylate cyclase domain-containing protein [Alphaproteobacteria bacterium]